MFNFLKRLFGKKVEANPNIIPMDILPAISKKKKRELPEYVGGLAEYNRPPVTKEYLDYLHENKIAKIRNGFGGGLRPGLKIRMSDRDYIVGRHGEWIRRYGEIRTMAV